MKHLFLALALMVAVPTFAQDKEGKKRKRRKKKRKKSLERMKNSFTKKQLLKQMTIKYI